MSQIGDHQEDIEVIPLYRPVPEELPEETPAIEQPQETPEHINK